MSGKDFIKEITSAKIPNMEQVRNNCHALSEQKNVVNRTSWAVRTIVVCACTVLIIATVLFKVNFNKSPIIDDNPVPQQTAEITTSVPDNTGNLQTTEFKISINSTDPVQTTVSTPDNSVTAQTTTPTVSNIVSAQTTENTLPHSQVTTKNITEPTGIYIPAIEPPKETGNAQACSIAWFIYQGRGYTGASFYLKEQAQYIRENLVGEKIGYAIGNIRPDRIKDKVITQDDYAIPFAGNIEGDVYTVKGYDESFRLCMMGGYTDDDGKYVEWVNFFENVSGITLTYGSDLFADRLHLLDRWESALCENENLVSDDGIYYRIDIVYSDLVSVSNKDITAFVKELYSGTFAFGVDDPSFFGYNHKPKRLNFYMNDGTITQLFLYEGGYAMYQNMWGWYYVEMPGKAFDRIYNACK